MATRRRRCSNFYPRPPRGGRPLSRRSKRQKTTNFYPRPPRGGRLVTGDMDAAMIKFLSTPSARRATRARRQRHRGGEAISIHALREEGDRFHVVVSSLPVVISIHALREEGDCRARHASYTSWVFLSTPSARRATRSCWTPAGCSEHFYPRPPRGGRHAAPAAGNKPTGFLSTPSARRATS